MNERIWEVIAICSGVLILGVFAPSITYAVASRFNDWTAKRRDR